MKPLYGRSTAHLASIWRFRHLPWAAIAGRAWDGENSCPPGVKRAIAWSSCRIGSGAQVATPDLMAEIVAGACTRVAMPGWAAKAAKIHRLIELEAWTEATLALVELELPQWRLRRLVCEEGYWLCSLSKQWNLPAWLSDSAEACHESLPLAILSAMIEARQGAEPLPGPAVGSVPQCGTQSGPLAQVMCCDNFA
jgi:hypothetical protein